MRYRVLTCMISIFLALFAWHSALAQGEIQVVNEEPVYTFNESILFSATLQADRPVTRVLVVVGPTGRPEEDLFLPATLDEAGRISARLDLIDHPFQAFATLDYRYQITLGDGEIFTTAAYKLQYLDNRFDWQTLESPPFRVHWFQGDVTFAQGVLNVAHAGERRLPEILEVYLPDELDIYVYASAADLQAALHSPNPTWVAGHADPELNVILVSLPPGPEQQLEIERQIPHELMHVALYYTDARTYENLPTWLNEGLASLAELYPSPEYQAILENAFTSGDLLPMASICEAFPTEPGQRLLAYAQSASFTSFLFEQFGTAGFNRLRAVLANNLGCRAAVENALGASLENLEGKWMRETFTGEAWQEALAELLPWLVLAGVVLIGPLIMAFGIARRPARMES